MENITSSNRILVGVDGSASSIDALRYAARLADALDAPIEVMVTWIYPGLMDYGAVSAWSPEDDARQIARDAVAAAFPDGAPARLTTSVANGPTASRLIAESHDAAMLVVGSRGHGGFAGLLLGSVSSACAEYAHCPVLIVHGPHATSPSEVDGSEPAGAGESPGRQG